MTPSRLCLLLVAGAALAMPVASNAQQITLRKDFVIPVKFDDTLTLKGNRVGDRFHTIVDGDPDLPKGTELSGQVVDLRPAKGKDPASMELSITDMTLPNGRHLDVSGTVVPMNEKYFNKDSRGRLTAKPQDTAKRGGTVLGGALGGLIVGSLIGKQLEATIIGALAGILIVETDRSNDGNTIVKKGDSMGVLIKEDLVVDITPDDDGTEVLTQETTANPPEREVRTQGEQTPPVVRDERILVTYGSRNILWDRNKPYWDGDIVMVPLEHTAIQMGLRSAKVKDNDRAFFVEGKQGYLQIEIDERSAKVNGREVELEVPVTKTEDAVYVPLHLLVAIAKDPVYLNGQKIEKPTL